MASARGRVARAGRGRARDVDARRDERRARGHPSTLARALDAARGECEGRVPVPAMCRAAPSVGHNCFPARSSEELARRPLIAIGIVRAWVSPARSPHRARWTILRRREEAIRDVVPRRGRALRALVSAARSPPIVRADASTSALASATSSSTLARRAASVAACTNHAPPHGRLRVARGKPARSAPSLPPDPHRLRPRDPRGARPRPGAVRHARGRARARGRRGPPPHPDQRRPRALPRSHTSSAFPPPAASADAPPSTSSAATSVSPRSASLADAAPRLDATHLALALAALADVHAVARLPGVDPSDGPNATRSVASSTTPSRASRATRSAIGHDPLRGPSPRTRGVSTTLSRRRSRRVSARRQRQRRAM